MVRDRERTAHLSEHEMRRVRDKRKEFVERGRRLVRRIPMLVETGGDPAEIQQAYAEETTVEYAIDLLQACEDGAFGTMPDRADIDRRNKLDLEISVLVARRNMLAHLRSKAATDAAKRAAEAEFSAHVREIAALDALRSDINVRLFNAKFVHSLLSV